MVSVAGIDPSLTATGVATEHGLSTVIYPRGCVGDQRLPFLWEQVENALRLTPGCDVRVVIEDLPIHAHGAGLTAMAHGVIRCLVASFRLRCVVVAPATLKKFATGKGNATKADMRMALFQRTGLDVRDDNQADAWWLREFGLHLRGEGSLDLPQSHLAALEKFRRVA